MQPVASEKLLSLANEAAVALQSEKLAEEGCSSDFTSSEEVSTPNRSVSLIDSVQQIFEDHRGEWLTTRRITELIEEKYQGYSANSVTSAVCKLRKKAGLQARKTTSPVNEYRLAHLNPREVHDGEQYRVEIPSLPIAPYSLSWAQQGALKEELLRGFREKKGEWLALEQIDEILKGRLNKYSFSAQFRNLDRLSKDGAYLIRRESCRGGRSHLEHTLRLGMPMQCPVSQYDFSQSLNRLRVTAAQFNGTTQDPREFLESCKQQIEKAKAQAKTFDGDVTGGVICDLNRVLEKLDALESNNNIEADFKQVRAALNRIKTVSQPLERVEIPPLTSRKEISPESSELQPKRREETLREKMARKLTQFFEEHANEAYTFSTLKQKLDVSETFSTNFNKVVQALRKDGTIQGVKGKPPRYYSAQASAPVFCSKAFKISKTPNFAIGDTRIPKKTRVFLRQWLLRKRDCH